MTTFNIKPLPMDQLPRDTTKTKLKNLIKLATHLYTYIPPPGFDISTFAHGFDFTPEMMIPQPPGSHRWFGEVGVVPPTDRPAGMTPEVYNHCGTTACAIGHGPYVGIKPRKFEPWDEYSSRTLINYYTTDWDWCFHSDWAYVDNTPKGAALRIKWLLENGLPDDWKDQMLGRVPLCYVEQTEPA